MIAFTSGRIRLELNEADVFYMESRRNGSIIRTFRFSYETTVPLSHWETILNHNAWFRCHESFLVHLSHAEELEEGCLRLADGQRIPVSRRKRTELRRMLVKYREGMSAKGRGRAGPGERH